MGLQIKKPQLVPAAVTREVVMRVDSVSVLVGVLAAGCVASLCGWCFRLGVKRQADVESSEAASWVEGYFHQSGKRQ